jgi:hypothetical protein
MQSKFLWLLFLTVSALDQYTIQFDFYFSQTINSTDTVSAIMYLLSKPAHDNSTIHVFIENETWAHVFISYEDWQLMRQDLALITQNNLNIALDILGRPGKVTQLHVNYPDVEIRPPNYILVYLYVAFCVLFMCALGTGLLNLMFTKNSTRYDKVSQTTDSV